MQWITDLGEDSIYLPIVRTGPGICLETGRRISLSHDLKAKHYCREPGFIEEEVLRLDYFLTIQGVCTGS